MNRVNKFVYFNSSSSSACLTCKELNGEAHWNHIKNKMLNWCCLKEITSHQLKADNERRKVRKKAERIYELAHNIANQAGRHVKAKKTKRMDRPKSRESENEQGKVEGDFWFSDSDFIFFWLEMASCCCCCAHHSAHSLNVLWLMAVVVGGAWCDGESVKKVQVLIVGVVVKTGHMLVKRCMCSSWEISAGLSVCE